MIKIIVILIVSVVVFILFVRYLESNSIFHPTPEVSVSPRDIGLDYENINFKTRDNQILNGWLVKAGGRYPTVLFFHGNAGNISHRLEKISMFHEMGVSLFIIDYRGYGKSSGTPSEEGIYEDAVAAYDYLVNRPDLPSKKIVAYGASLGGVVAVNLATKRPCAGVIVDSSFPAAADLSKTIFPFIPTCLLKSKMDSLSKVKTLAIPKLFIHSINDEIVPYRLGEKLYNGACLPKTFLQVTGGHNTNHIDSKETWSAGILEFLTGLD